MQNKRSIEAQRARLLGKKSTPKKISDKFVKKEIINIKYGLKKSSVSSKTNVKNFYISVTVFMLVLIVTIFSLQPLLSFIISAVTFIVSLGILNSYQSKRAAILPKAEYNINYVFEKYDLIILDEIKEKMIAIKDYVDILNSYELPLGYKHYVQSTVSKDIPDIFNHFSHLQNETNKIKVLEQLTTIESKLLEIKKTVEPDYEQKLEIKSRVIKEKAAW